MMRDRIRMLISIQPKHSVSQVVGYIRGNLNMNAGKA